MTEIIALGTGSAFTMKNYQTNFLVKRNGKYLLIDCGTDIRFSLQKVGLSFKDIDAVYISHLHSDHCGGMEYLGFTRYFTRKGMEVSGSPNPLPLPTLYCERGLMRNLWDHTMRGGMECLEGIECTLESYFNVHPIEKNGSFQWEGLTFDMVQSLHISAKYSIVEAEEDDDEPDDDEPDDDTRGERSVDSFGLMFNDLDTIPEGDSEHFGFKCTRIFIPTDVQFAPETSLKAYYAESDVIIHDCETMYKSGVHAHYDDLRTLKPEIKRKMKLIHYQDNVLDDWDNWQNRAVNEDGFAGFVKPGVIYRTELHHQKMASSFSGTTNPGCEQQV